MRILAGPAQVNTIASVGSGAWVAIGWSDEAKGTVDSHHLADSPGLTHMAEGVVGTLKGYNSAYK